MRGPGLLVATLLALAAPAFAQPAAENTRAACTDGVDNDGDGHVDCADQDCQDFTFCAAPTPRAGIDELARLRGRGTTRVVVGAVLLSVGVVVAGVSSLLWVESSGHSGFNDFTSGAVAMDTIGLAMMGGGTALLAIGAGNLAEARRPRVAFGATSLAVRF